MLTISFPLTFAVLSVLALPLLSGCGRDNRADAAVVESAQVISVRAEDVLQSADVEPLRFAGVVRARQRAGLTFQVGGVLRNRVVELGQQVKSGEMLAALYNPELEPARDAARARLRELQAQAEQAIRDVQRAEQLFERGVVSAHEHEQQRARLATLEAGVGSAQAALRQAERFQGESQLRAPFDGSIEALLVEPGEFVAAGQPVMRLAAMGGMEVQVRVPAAMLDGLEVGQSVPVWNSLTGELLDGRIAEIGQGVSQGGSLYPLTVSLDQGGQSGDAVEVGLQRQRQGSLEVPLAAVMRSAEGLSVFRVVSDRVERVSVQVSALQGERAILAGSPLQSGDRVVYAGLTRLSDGDRVELLP